MFGPQVGNVKAVVHLIPAHTVAAKRRDGGQDVAAEEVSYLFWKAPQPVFGFIRHAAPERNVRVRVFQLANVLDGFTHPFEGVFGLAQLRCAFAEGGLASLLACFVERDAAIG
jgi:hypothetical protein